MLVGCPAGDEWTWQSAAGYQSGLVSVSAGATLYVFLCIFFRERRRSGRGRRCRKRPPVSKTPPLQFLLFSLSIPCFKNKNYFVCVASCSRELQHLSIDDASSFTCPLCNKRGQTPSHTILILASVDWLWFCAGTFFSQTFFVLHALHPFVPSLSLASPSSHITPTLGLVCPFYTTYLPILGFFLHYLFACCTYSMSFCWPCLAYAYEHSSQHFQL